ncbi:MAG: hypothetical protein UZ12_BCD005003349 [Bacteroidetes bacterium OLB12]|nr:MAG: hypothetical protein UZ12_BCD005003349 [Bacteroidetes bacterium OLB12]
MIMQPQAELNYQRIALAIEYLEIISGTKPAFG